MGGGSSQASRKRLSEAPSMFWRGVHNLRPSLSFSRSQTVERRPVNEHGGEP